MRARPARLYAVTSFRTQPVSAAAGRPPGGAAPGISLTGLAKAYRTSDGPVRAVDGVDLEIAPGETVALLGPNGAGKSTTIDMILGLHAPDSGTVRIFGDAPQDAVRVGRIGAMLQTGGLIRDLSVRELITMMASLYPHPLGVDEVIDLAGISDVAARRTHKLSGGQTQRVRAALALVSNPDVLILDEPTVAMDVEARHAFWATMRGVTTGGKTVLFATHYLEEADAFADRIVLMARGRIVADGPATEIKSVVGGRTIRATLPDADLGELQALPGVTSADRRGEAILLTCADSDAAVRALLAGWPAVRDLEITGAGLEQAFLQLTGDNR
jgi:ABC-2 type transport system ATP-binding protein